MSAGSNNFPHLCFSKKNIELERREQEVADLNMKLAHVESEHHSEKAEHRGSIARFDGDRQVRAAIC